MPTYEQLRAETWWNREITTDAIDWLGDNLCERTGRPRSSFGNKGDRFHVRGSHRSQEWLLKSRYATSRSYTVQPGLTALQARYVSGIDFTPGSAASMIAQCKRLWTALRAGRLEAVREFYGNIDGDKVVDGWDNVRNQRASSDSSHLWHWHLSLDRRRCNDRELMEQILAIVLGEDDDMPSANEVAAATWARPFKSYVTDPATGARPSMPTSDALYSIHRDAYHTRVEVTALRAVVEQLAATIQQNGGNVDTAAILGGVDARLALLLGDVRDMVADLGEGGAAQVRAG